MLIAVVSPSSKTVATVVKHDSKRDLPEYKAYNVDGGMPKIQVLVDKGITNADIDKLVAHLKNHHKSFAIQTNLDTIKNNGSTEGFVGIYTRGQWKDMREND